MNNILVGKLRPSWPGKDGEIAALPWMVDHFLTLLNGNGIVNPLVGTGVRPGDS